MSSTPIEAVGAADERTHKMILTVSTRPDDIGGYEAVVRNADERAITAIGSFKSRHDAYKAACRLRDNLLKRIDALSR